MANLKECAEQLKLAMGDNITDAGAKQLVSRLNKLARQISSQQGTPLPQALNEAAELFAEGGYSGAKSELKRRYDKLRLLRNDEKLMLRTLEEGGLAADRIVQLLGASKNRPGYKAANGVNQVATMRIAHTWQAIHDDMVAEGVWLTFTGKEMRTKGSEADKKLARELWALGTSRGASESVTGDAEVHKLAKVIYKWQKANAAENNMYGANIGELDTFVAHQAYSTEKIREMGRGREKYATDPKEASYEAFYELVMANVDSVRTFQGDDPVTFLRAAHEALYNNRWTKDIKDTADELAGQNTNFTLTGSLADRISQSRVFHWKDADAHVAVNSAIGVASTAESFIISTKSLMRSSALMQQMGGNPGDYYKSLVKLAKQIVATRPDSAKQLKRFEDWRISENLYDDPNWINATGMAEKRNMPDWSRWIDNARMLNKAALLQGSGILSFFVDPAAGAMVLHQNGVPWPQAIMGSFRARFPKDKELKRFLSSLGAISEMASGELIRGVDDSRVVSNKIRGIMSATMKWNGLDGATTSMKQGVLLALNKAVTEHAGDSFDQLPARMQAAMRRHGIEELEWNLIRSMEKRGFEGDLKLIDPYAVREIPDGQLDLFASKEGLGSDSASLEKARRELFTRLMTWFNDETEVSVASPDASVRRTMYGATLAGTPEGAALRMVMDLKSFSIGVFQNIIGREFLSAGHSTIAEGMVKNKGAWLHVAAFAAQATVLGYMAWSAKEMLKGRTAPPLMDEDGKLNMSTILGAAQRGGGLGIMGDFFLSEYDKRTRGLLAQMAGPTLGQAETVYAALAKVRDTSLDGAPEFPIVEVQRLIEGNTPFISLPYIRPVVNYLFYYNLQELIRPDLFESQRKALERSTGQESLTTFPLMAPAWEGQYLRPFE